ncbi:hypothetical protein THOA03_160147 [Vibrio owensii]|nr:hypothetical protein THOA03_160147 [Vibrio owensii]
MKSPCSLIVLAFPTFELDFVYNSHNLNWMTQKHIGNALNINTFLTLFYANPC